MARRVLVDTGPIVALLDRRDTHHEWAKKELANLQQPLLTCEAVISETFFLLGTVRGGVEAFCGLLKHGLVQPDPEFSYGASAAQVLDSLFRYRDLPMTFADACLLKMSEMRRDCLVFTTDGDFLTYRRYRRERIPLISPF